MAELQDFEEQTEEFNNFFEENPDALPKKDEGFQYEEEVIITKIS